MSRGTCLSVALAALLCAVHAEHAPAQADSHVQAIGRSSCQNGKRSEAVVQASVALERDPEELGPRLRLADALVDQGCYQEAVTVLEAGQQSHPRSSELSGKLRDVRSLVTEQTYIEGLTQAAEGAKFQRNQLRCTRLADVTACEDALKSKPDDEQLLVAKGDALMQGNRPVDAVAAYRHAAQVKPGDEAVKTKLAAAEALQAKIVTPAPEAVSQSTLATTATRAKAPRRAPARVAPPPAEPGPVATVASLGPQEARTFSNDATPGRTN